MEPSQPSSLAVVVAAGDRVKSLRALRDRLAADIDDCGSLRDLASLSQRLMDVLAQIEACETARPEAEGTALDELSSRRRVAGRPDASSSTRAARAAQRS